MTAKIKRELHDVLTDMMQIAMNAGLCGSWYPMTDENEVTAICLEPVSESGQTCPACNQRLHEWNSGNEQRFEVVPQRKQPLCQKKGVRRG